VTAFQAVRKVSLANVVLTRRLSVRAGLGKRQFFGGDEILPARRTINPKCYAARASSTSESKLMDGNLTVEGCVLTLRSERYLPVYP